MRLKALKIENFGTLSDFSLEFSDKLTVINEQNGFGKTTLALFLKAMLYGLPKTTKKKVAENERMRLTPWQGGLFGGTLDFEVGDKAYRIERFFSDKNGDTFKLIDLKIGRESKDYSENIGLELFSIDAESFERSVYIPQASGEVLMNLSLNAKLTGLVENSDDLSSFDKAYEKLEKRAKEYKALRGNKGILSELEAEAEELRREIKDSKANRENLKRVAEELKALKEQLNRTSCEKDEIRRKITAASDRAALLEQKKSRDALKSELNELELRLRKITEAYPDGFPVEEELDKAKGLESVLSKAETELKLLSSDTADKVALEKAETFFDGKPTDFEELGLLKQKAQRLSALQIKAEALGERMGTVGSSVFDTGNNKSGIKLLLIISFFVLLSGSAVTAFITALGVSMLALGVLGIGFAGFLYLKNQISGSKTVDNRGLTLELEQVEAERETIALELTAFIEKYIPVSDFLGDVDIIYGNLKELMRLKNAVIEQNNKISARQSRFSESSKELTEFFNKYGRGEKTAVVAVEQDMKDAAVIRREISVKADRLASLPEVKTEALEAYEGLDREVLLLNEQELNCEIDRIQNEISIKQSAEDKLSRGSEQLALYEERLEDVVAEHTEKKEHYEVLRLTAELLAKAKENLSTRYLDKMTEGFKLYCDTLNGTPQNSMVSPELAVSVEKNGRAKEQAYFSEGLQDMMNIAMHLALADALFQGEAPMLILDDPFVNLDDIRLKNALALLKKLAEKRQIVYLTCHSSRNAS